MRLPIRDNFAHKGRDNEAKVLDLHKIYWRKGLGVGAEAVSVWVRPIATRQPHPLDKHANGLTSG